MLRKLHLGFVIMLLFSMNMAIGQKHLRKADKQVQLKAYELAILNYQKVLEKDPANIYAMIGLADAFRLSNKTLEASRWYAKAISTEEDIKPIHKLNYAHTLKSIGMYDKAHEMYLEFREVDPIISEHFALSCDFAKTLLQEEMKYDVSLFGANSSYSEYGVSFYNNKLVYASFSPLNETAGEGSNFSYIERTGNRLYTSEAWKAAQQANKKPLRSELRQQEGIGPLSYSRNGKMLAYTKNNFVNGHSLVTQNEDGLSIYTAMVDPNGDFYADQGFTYNSTEYSNAFPNLSFGGNAMYFSSNQPGGYGGFDIYVSYFKDGEWTKPENLGNRINSKGDEITPFFDGEKLYFSSDYHHGLGGYDVFVAEVVSGEWRFPENMGKGINSTEHDYFYAIDLTTGHRYVSSNRIGGNGLDDIYLISDLVNEDFAGVELLDTETTLPRAVALSEMAEESALENNEILAKEERGNTKPIVESTLALEKEMTNMELAVPIMKSFNASVDLKGARRVSIGEIINGPETKVYFVQLASLSRSKAKLDRFSKLATYGNIYKIYKSNSTKIRLGYYYDKSEAKAILDVVRKEGFTDAFIASESLNTATMELAISSYDTSVKTNTNTSVSKPAKKLSNYKVRLASYADPLWFDVAAVEDMGKIEQWTKGSWTIFVLGGYTSLEDAKKAKVEAISRGFADAELVVDSGGVLTKFRD